MQARCRRVLLVLPPVLPRLLLVLPRLRSLRRARLRWAKGRLWPALQARLRPVQARLWPVPQAQWRLGRAPL